MFTAEKSVDSLRSARCHRFCTCWKIVRKDNVTYRFTDNNTSIVLLGETYSPVAGVSVSAIQSEAGFRGANSEVAGIISSPNITTEALREGRFRGAVVHRYVVDWRYAFAGYLRYDKFLLNQPVFTGERWEGQLDGMSLLLRQQLGDVATSNCRYTLGDAGCKVNLASFTSSGAVVQAVTSRLLFTASHADFSGKAAEYYNLGVITWTSGANSGLTSEVALSGAPSGNVISFTLLDATPLNIAASDAFSIYPGCDLLESTCIAKFNNIVNFGGFNYMPGTDKVIRSPADPS